MEATKRIQKSSFASADKCENKKTHLHAVVLVACDGIAHCSAAAASTCPSAHATADAVPATAAAVTTRTDEAKAALSEPITASRAEDDIAPAKWKAVVVCCSAWMVQMKKTRRVLMRMKDLLMKKMTNSHTNVSRSGAESTNPATAAVRATSPANHASPTNTARTLAMSKRVSAHR